MNCCICLFSYRIYPSDQKPLSITKGRSKTAIITFSCYKGKLENITKKRREAEILKKKKNEVRQTKKVAEELKRRATISSTNKDTLKLSSD